MLHETLWDENADLAQACLDHPFCRGLADGSLDRDAFRRYVAQDAFFLEAFARGYAVAAARAPELHHIRTFHDLLDGVLEELELHAEYAEELSIDLDAVEPHAETRAYTDFILRTAWSGGIDEFLAAMVPCMRVYAWLGGNLAAEAAPDTPYADWIETYSDDEFHELAGRLEDLLDELGEDRPAVHDAYRYSMEREVAFFSAPL